MVVSDLSARLETLSPEKRALVERSLKARRAAAADSARIPRRDDDGPAPLSFAQQRMWFLEQWEPGGFTHNGARAFRLEGELDASALDKALVEMVERHEALRTVYLVERREPRQQVLQEWDVRLDLVDLTSLEADAREQELARRLRELCREPFDLTSDVMLRSTLFRLAPDEHVLLIRLHHIAFDAFSDGVFFGELARLYAARVNGSEPELAELPIQYADFAVWQHGHLAGTQLEKLVEHWRSELDGAPPLLRLPLDGSRRSPQRHEGRHHPLSIEGALASDVIAFGRSVGATPYMTLLSAFGVLLYRITGQDDVVVGTPIANRVRPELEHLVGFFSNTVAMRLRLGGNPSFRDVVQRTRATALRAYANQELPFERIVEELQVPRDARYNPIFQVNFRAQADERRPLELPGVRATAVAIDIGFSRFDLALELQLERDRVGGYIEYDLDLFEDDTIATLAADVESALDQLVRNPDRSILELKLDPRWRNAARRSNSAIPRSRKS
jgi:Condensation domain